MGAPKFIKIDNGFWYVIKAFSNFVPNVFIIILKDKKKWSILKNTIWKDKNENYALIDT